MFRRLSMVGIFLAFGLSVGMPLYWRTLSRSLPQQGQRVTVQFQRVIYAASLEDIKRPAECPSSSLGKETNSPSITIPLSYECQGAKVTGQASVSFPAGPLSGTLDANGDLVLDSPASLSGKIDLTAQSSAGFVAKPQTLGLNLFCAPEATDSKNIELTPKQWSVTSSCSLRKISRGLLFPNVFTHQRIDITFTGGGRIALFGGFDFADFAPITAPTPTPTPANRVPNISVQTEVFATNDCPVTIIVKKDGVIDTSFNGSIKVSLTTDKPRLGCLLADGQCAASLTLSASDGSLRLKLRTPQQELTRTSVLRAGETPLQGTATITAELGSATAPAQTVKVKSPLDLKVERIEVQQGYKPVFESDLSAPFVQYRDLLIRVFLDANRLEFDKYASIRDLTAQLTVRNQSGNEIAGSPFTLSLGALAKGTDTPSEPYVFQVDAADAQGSDSLNHVLYVTQEQLNLSVKLNEVYADKDPTNDEKPLPPLRFVTSKPVTVLYSPAKLKSGALNTFCPTEAGIARQINFTQLAYPVSLPESGGQLRFIQAPNPSKNEACETLTGDALPSGASSEWWFWVNRTKRSDVKAWVYFVDDTYFQLLRPEAIGISNRLGGSVAIVSDRCLGPGTNSRCEILAHELGHLYSLGDTYKFGTPVHNWSLNPPGTDDVGNPVGSGTFSWFHHKFSVSSNDFTDFMGANLFSWTDRVNWNYLRSQLLPVANSVTEPELNPLAAATVVESFVIVQGQVRKNGTAALSNCYTLTGEGLASPSGAGSYVIETLDGNAAVLNRLTFTPSFRLPDSAIELEAADFSFALPFSNAVRQIRLRSDAGIQATRQVSANAPVIRFTTDFGGQTLTGSKTVAWSGTDADGQALNYSLFYSPDGQLQIPLALETTDTSYEWDTAAVPAGSASRLTLTATDGANATTIESPTFTLPNHAPRVVIVTPLDQQQFKTGETVLLEGALNDPEDGLLPRPRLIWTSSLQGALGTGKQITVSNLPAGTHLITAAGTDTQGARGSATITVIVRADNFSNLEAAPGSVDFGTIAIGQTRDLTLSVQNTGNVPFTVTALTSSNPQFRVTAPSTPFTVAARSLQDVTLRFTPLAPDTQTGTLTIASNASNRTSASIALTGKATGTAARAVATVSAASYNGQTLAPESIVAAFGANLATGVAVNSTLPLPTTLGGTTIRVRDNAGFERLAPLFFVSPQQINYLIPPGTALGTATITVTSGDGSLSVGNVTIANIAPGLFAANANGQGIPAAIALRVKADGTLSYENIARYDEGQNRFVAVPIDLGPASEQVFLLLFGTGLRFHGNLPGVTCKLGGVDAPVLYASAQGDLTGLDQVNVSLPRTLIGRGEVDLLLTVNGQAANTVRVAFAGNQPCNYALTPASQNFAASAGTGNVNVAAPNGCTWTATSNASFITITSGANGNGNGAVNYAVAANTATSQRTGTLTIAGQTFTVTQAAQACTYALAPTSQSFNANANAGSVNVTAQSGCAWTATSNASFITITSGANGNGNGAVNFTVAANPTTNPRTGTLVIAGQTFTVTQAAQACAYAIAPTSQSFNANANTGSVNVTASSGCAWAATSNASFITITSGANGNGNGAVNYAVAANTATSQRTGTLTIAGQTFTVTQAAAAPLTVVERRVTGGPIPDGCSPPAAKTAFLTTDERVYQWTLVSGAKIGDLVRWEFSPANGSIVQTQQYTVAFNDSLCFWASLNVAGSAAAASPGDWQVRVFYNNALLFTDNFSITSVGARVTDRRVTGGPFPDQCAPPPAKTSFAPTDGQAYLWTLMAGAKIGDLARWEFVQPNGTIYNTSEYTVTFNDSVCFWGGINIAGTRAATLPGAWQVRLFYNGNLLLTENFTITAGAASFLLNQEKALPTAFSGSGQARPR